MKRIIKCLIFIILFLIISQEVFKVIWLYPTSITEVYREKKNTLDVLYFGASNAYAHFNTTLAFNEQGFTTGLVSTDNQSIFSLKLLMEDLRKRQNPEVYVVDLVMFSSLYFDEGSIRKVVDSMPSSLNRIKMINKLLPLGNIPKEDYLNYYFSFMTYHGLWKEINKTRFKSEVLYKGYLFDETTSVIKEVEEKPWNKEIIRDIPDKIFKELQEVLNYIKNEKLNVLFVLTPRVLDEDTMGILNNEINYIEKEGYKVLNLYQDKVIDIDYNHDLYNYGHLNVYGASKYTIYLANYLKENYNLPDHRQDKKYSSWNEEYIRFKNKFKELTKEDYEEVINNVK